MFEQSILLPERGGKKPWTFAVSILVEVSVVSVVLLIPLVYTDRLGLGLIQASQLHISPPTPRPITKAVEPTTIHRPMRRFDPMAPPTKVVRLDLVLNNLSNTPLPDCPSCVAGALPADGPIGVVGIGTLGAAPPPQPKPQPKPAEVKKPVETKPAEPLRVSRGTQEALIIRRVMPIYPPLAKQARVQGTVKLQGVISVDGRIEQLHVLSGHPLLVPAAVEAVKQWLYRPTLLSGTPVAVIAPIDVNFILSN